MTEDIRRDDFPRRSDLIRVHYKVTGLMNTFICQQMVAGVHKISTIKQWWMQKFWKGAETIY